MKPTLSKQTIVNVFEGKASPLQKSLVQEWLEVPENQELYFQWLEEWERDNPQFFPDQETAYRKSLQQRQNPATPFLDEAAEGKRVRSGRYIWRLAASVLLLLSSGTALFFKDELLYRHYETSYGEIRTFTLPDESRVVLNANTTLKIPRFDLSQTDRRAWLSGEAEFSVKHTKDHRRFVVSTPDNLEVQVLGTEFIVYSRNRGSKVVLNKGKVQIRLKDQTAPPLVIRPGDVVNLSRQGRLTLRHQQPVSQHGAWKDHRFIFNNTTMSEVASQLTERFGVRFVIRDSTLARRTLGGTFKARTPDEILPILCDMLNLEVRHGPDAPDTYELISLP
ncbi:FecR family protein [Larkinella insperata]|uniref:FecR family protein n=1 Tax=Larkinella insperata TaxID=332158 RepID=A0ABW3QJC4_9BACT|nr:FecR domain-containing protein [Larkinella insperata]